MKLLAIPPAVAVIGQQATPGPDLSPLAYWGIAGVLLAFILWLYLDERREHKALRDKFISDVLPALLGASEAVRDSSGAMERMTVVAHQLSGRGIDPVVMAEWSRTMRDVQRHLEER